MTWARLDTGFVRHPKILSLSLQDRWTWVEILSWCAEFQTKGALHSHLKEVVPRASTRVLERYRAAGLLDADEHGLRVHDWDLYNPRDPTNAERQARFRNAKRNASAVTETAVESNGPSRDRAGAPVRPVPIGTPYPLPSKGDLDCINCGASGLKAGQSCPECGANPRRAGSNPRGEEYPPRPPTSDKVALVCRRWLESPAFDPESMTAETAADEFQIIERRLKVVMTPSQWSELLALVEERIAVPVPTAAWEGEEP